MTNAWADAACRGQMPLMALPAPGSAGRASRRVTIRIAQAKMLCRSCPIQQRCLEWALGVPDPAVGMIAGGTTPDERVRLRREDAAALIRDAKRPPVQRTGGLDVSADGPAAQPDHEQEDDEQGDE